jgi:hypothetical protein
LLGRAKSAPLGLAKEIVGPAQTVGAATAEEAAPVAATMSTTARRNTEHDVI